LGCNDNSNPVTEQSDPQQTKELNILALGDSYTIGESVNVNERWPVQLKDSLEKYGINIGEVRIIAKTGWTTANLINAIDNQVFSYNYDLVGLLIGVNNQFQGRSINEYEIQFEQLVETAISLAGNDTSRVFIFSIPDYSVTPTGGQFGGGNTAQEIDQFNDVNRNISEQFNIPYFNITPISRQAINNPDLIASDNLHFSGKMYSLWVKLILPDIITEISEDILIF
jgi:lysophospholipase L1-like esterase